MKLPWHRPPAKPEQMPSLLDYADWYLSRINGLTNADFAMWMFMRGLADMPGFAQPLFPDSTPTG